MLYAEQNSSNAKTESIIFLKAHNIRSISEQKNQFHVMRSERNALHAAIREKQTRMKAINRLRQERGITEERKQYMHNFVNLAGLQNFAMRNGKKLKRTRKRKMSIPMLTE